MSREGRFAEVVLWCALLGVAVLTGASVYQRVAIIPDWGGDLPSSLTRYFRGTNQARDILRFWQPAVVVMTVLMVAALALNWSMQARRKWLVLAAICYFGALAATLSFFVPQGVVPLFVRAGEGMRPDEIVRAARRWIFWDWFRVAALVGTFFSLAKAVGTAKADLGEKLKL